MKEKYQKQKLLLQNIKENLPKIQSLLKDTETEDLIYRFYHGSFKVYRIQKYTERIVSLLKELLPGERLNGNFLEVLEQGTGITFELEHNREWNKITRPMLEAFWHARFFLEMAEKYAAIDKDLTWLPSGWAALLYLYRIR